jgi:hypothetical protein
MSLDLTDEETAAPLRELDALIDGDRYFMSQRIKTLRAIRAKIRPEPEREPLPATAEAICATAGDIQAEKARWTLSCSEAAPCLPARFRWLIRAGCCSVSLLKFAELCSKRTYGRRS